MVETRAQDLPGPDGILGTADDVHQFINQDTPFVDQSQTYASDPSHQVFLREYIRGVDGQIHSTGALLGHHDAGPDEIPGTADDPKVTMATWADLKANAATFLGLKITDYDVGNVPVLNVDAYGNVIRGPHGFAQFKVTFADEHDRFRRRQRRRHDRHPRHRSGDRQGVLRGPHRQRLHQRHGAERRRRSTPRPATPLLADTNTVIDPVGPPLAAGTYDNESLNIHYVAGDGRVNENVGLTAIQELFHSEHDRLLAQTRDHDPAEPRRR